MEHLEPCIIIYLIYNITSFVQFVICRLAANGTVQEFDFHPALNKITYTPLSLRWDDTAAKRHLDLAIIPTECSHLGRDNTYVVSHMTAALAPNLGNYLYIGDATLQIALTNRREEPGNKYARGGSE